jgi:amidophosphoribosyltransferase
MCGIVGVAGIDRAAELAYLGLYALQHRGQEAAGISAVDDNGRARLEKEHGLVVESFSDTVMAELPGHTALGHVRYSTAGGPGLVNAQPILVRYHQGDLSLVHNGNITNASHLREQLVGEGALFQTTVDSEVVVHLIARSRASTVDEQIVEALSQLTGAFSVIITVGKTMYAARDPWGFRPLILGQLSGGYVVASETCALDLMGATTEREIGPGEILKVSDGRLEVLPASPHRCGRRRAYSNSSTSHDPTRASGTPVLTGPDVPSAASSPGSSRRTQTAYSACPTPRTPRHSGTPNRAVFPSSWA